MSLEAHIAELNTNIKALIDAIGRGMPVAASTVAAAADNAAAVTKPAATEKKEAAKAEGKKPEATGTQSAGATSESQASTAPSGTGASEANPDTEAPTYDQVKAKLLTLSKEKGREPTVALLARHGVTKGPDLKPVQYAQFIADVDAILAGEMNPEESLA